jgi:hypothetical protein
MLWEFFWKNSNKTSFHFRNYSAQNKRNTKHTLDNLHLIDEIESVTKITAFDMICPNSDADLVKKVCLSLLEWANYLLESYADIESKDDSKLKSDNNQRGPMLSYKMTDNIITWKSETATETTQTDASNLLIGDEWCKHDFDVDNKTNATSICNVGNALQLCHTRYEKLKKMIAKLLQVLHSQWLYQNFTSHNKTRSYLRLQCRKDVLKEVDCLMDTNPDINPQGSQYLLEMDFTSLYNASFERQSYWVPAMKAAWQEGRCAKHNSKLRGASHCWRQAKARKPCVVYNFSRDTALMNHELQLETQSRRWPHHSSTDNLNPSNKRRKPD